MLNKNTGSFFLISFIIAISYPLINIYYIYPLFKNLVITETEDEAVLLARHLVPFVSGNKHSLKEAKEFKDELEQHFDEFHLEKLKVFKASGEIIYSTDKRDIGDINTKNYFHEIVARGNPFTKVVQKGTKTLENRAVDVDVVETYVPIIVDGMFIGAFEIYYDITASKAKLDNLLTKSAIVPLLLMVCFLLTIVIFLFKSETHSIEKVSTNRFSVKYQSPFYFLLITIFVIFVNEALAMKLIDGNQNFPVSSIISDSSLLVLLASPMLYLFLGRPLMHHITEKMAAEEKLRRYQDKLEEMVQERTAELQKATNKLKTLSGLLPICISCKKIRDDQGYWKQLETYIQDNSEAEITHSICEECERKKEMPN